MRALIAALVLVLASLVAPAPAVAACSVPMPLAHRGGVELHTENTLGALASTGDNGISAVEIDVRFARNGTPVLMHDSTVDRTTNGTGKVADKDWHQIALLETVDGQHVPSLGSALRIAKAHGITTVVVHLKRSEPTAANWKAITGAMNRTEMRTSAIVMSRYQRVARQAKERGLRSALLDRKDQDRTAAYLRQYGRMYTVPLNGTTAADVERWRAGGVATNLGVKRGDHPSLWADAATTGATRVLTDHPIAYQTWRNLRCGAIVLGL